MTVSPQGPETDWQTAVHEAGHALVGYVEGAEVVNVRMYPSEDGKSLAATRLRPSPATSIRAGLIAQMVLGTGWSTRQAESDFQYACSAEEQARCKAILEAHVEHLAALGELLRERIGADVPGAEVHAFLDGLGVPRSWPA